MKFESAVDWWFYLVIAIVAITLWFSLVPQVKAGQLSSVFAGSIALFSLGLPVWLLLATDYTVAGDSLLIRSGPISWEISVSEIHSANPSRSSLSSPALSLDRIELRYGEGKTIMVSPKDSQAFLKAIGQTD